ncbi:MAG: OmpA family protein [Deltaproteobacteria bacterium]|nr:OmpA family protein [Deltaproteobacteria bacterium]
MKKYIYAVMLIMGIFVGLSGCATPQYGQDIDARIDRIEQGIALNRQEINDLKITMGALSATVQEAIDRAEEAGKLAQGKFLFEATISDDSVFFAFDKNELTDEGRKALDVFAEVMKAENKNIYIEIQGHTDSTGPEEYNLELGSKRAKSVMKYLHLNHNLPLRCMNEFSYGESRPVADNAKRKNRAKNRRVTIVGMV